MSASAAFTITPELITKLLATVDAGLRGGTIGNRVPGQMCVEAAVCFALGEPHSDNPSCVHDDLRQLKITLNDDTGWRSNKSRAAGLRRLAVAQLGTKHGFDADAFKQYLLRLVVSDLVLDFVDSELRAIIAQHPDETSFRFFAQHYNAVLMRNRQKSHEFLAIYSTVTSIHGIFTWLNRSKRFHFKEKRLVWLCEEIVQVLVKMETPGSKWLPEP
jgi:hypothetical protein